MAALAAGKLRHYVALQEPQTVQDAVTGEPAISWVTVAQLWASIEPLSGRDFLAAGAEQSEVRGRITVRYRETITAEMRIAYRGKVYTILAVLPDNDSGIEHLTLMVAEGVRFYEDDTP